MLVEFAQNIVTDWNELLASESDSRFNRTQKLLALDDGTTDADIIDATVVIGQLRGPNEPSDASTVATSLLFAESTNLRTSDEDVLPEVMLMANNPSTQQTLPSTTVSPPSPTTCSYTGTVSTGSPVTVLIAISSCWSEVGFPKIEDWITTLECQDSLYFQGSTANKMVYLRRTIDDGCNKPSNAPPYLTQADPTPIAVISIMVYATGANRVQTYVTSNNVPTFLKYVYYNSPGYVTPIAGYQAIPYRCENGATLMTAIDPFYVSRSIHCKDMPGGIPTSYIDGSGKRQCFCGCQQGYELKGSQCMPVQDQACQCSWDKVTNGFKFEVKLDQPSSYLSPSNTCVIKNLALTSTSGLIPVPVARDNYVDHNNVNDKDLTLPISATAPHIDVKKQKATVSVKQGSSGTTGTETGDAMYSTSSYTWKDYQSSSIAKINSIEFNYVGKYNIELFAKDYSNAATCDGCVAVVDSRRPTANPNYQSDRAVATSDFLYTSEEAKGYVFWRYNVDSGAWKSWTAIAQETFAKASTSITVEAWTQCGKVEAFTFKVELHLNNIIRVCDHFDDMWYQMTTAPQFLTNQQFCLFPKSDFAEITFDYHPNIGIDFDVNKFQMSVSSVTCTLSYDGKKPVTIVDSNGLTSFEIVRQFAVNAVDVTTTKDHTVVSVSCDFTYVRKVDDKKVLQKCGQSFTLTDCEAPVFNRPCELDGKCNFNKCAQKTGPTDPRPDLYQACGGNRISQDTLGNTAFTTTDSTCCDSCDTTTYSTACVPISTFPTGAIPGSKYVKRCDAIPKASTPLLAVADMDAEKTQGASTTNVAAVLSASALVALVAMIVIKRRRTEAIKVEQDAYYPLMG
ncbi:hypothetical protein BBO99_00007273 [Phytophthora kernoviae]|uniref:Uncharacterized protein n=2 Tax=Phytophthora kernoviae TaxID=325452 RepID=A0A421ETE8_9STRA|nr:hypothetical protein G195_008070 [Phytophthora kernoviae 00238/432]KAG2521054.1 hypothetical protein JM18_006767 [Phytophthora kernoviae]KAG2522599.1 hypothetical protein JM16_003379 [Phytophthora kernoviae]RLN01231.1 hypothetical protein BBI17_007249 [Phytophthora kernoviae]RLN76787.1 hypothetical protein BBO99_00007273 [Phytophthora kernoviae]